MPTAFCHTCNTLTHWNKKHIHMKDVKCGCGNTKLVSVSSRFSDDYKELHYFDRAGNKLYSEEFIPIPVA